VKACDDVSDCVSDAVRLALLVPEAVELGDPDWLCVAVALGVSLELCEDEVL
jgi:hypothetical protein